MLAYLQLKLILQYLILEWEMKNRCPCEHRISQLQHNSVHLIGEQPWQLLVQPILGTDYTVSLSSSAWNVITKVRTMQKPTNLTEKSQSQAYSYMRNINIFTDNECILPTELKCHWYEGFRSFAHDLQIYSRSLGHLKYQQKGLQHTFV